MLKQLSSLTRFIRPALFTPPSSILPNMSCLRNFSLLSGSINPSALAPMTAPALLQPRTSAMIPERGFKQMGRLKRRCKDCFFIRRFDRLLVLCKTHPRHKQMAMQKKPKNTWILTDATQGKQRAW